MKLNDHRSSNDLVTRHISCVLFIPAVISTMLVGCIGQTEDAAICERVTLSQRGELGLDLSCDGSIRGTTSNISRDQFGRATSYNFDLGCGDGSEQHTGRVSGIAWNSLGQALSASVVINGDSVRLTNTYANGRYGGTMCSE